MVVCLLPGKSIPLPTDRSGEVANGNQLAPGSQFFGKCHEVEPKPTALRCFVQPVVQIESVHIDDEAIHEVSREIGCAAPYKCTTIVSIPPRCV